MRRKCIQRSARSNNRCARRGSMKRKMMRRWRVSVSEEDACSCIDLLLDDDVGLSSSKLNIAASIPIAPMSPQLSNVRSSILLSQHASSSIVESKPSSQTKKSTYVSPTSSYRSQRMSMTTASITHPRHRPCNIDSSAANSSSTSPINLSRSTSPAASIANFIRPISPPYIQVKEPLSPKFPRASSHVRHRSPPPVNIPPIANNIDASTASATTTLLIDDSSGYDSSENQNHRSSSTANPTIAAASSIISTVPESCFEPETYRNLYPLTGNQQKKLSLSDPTLNQISKLSHRSHQPQSQTTGPSHLSASSLQRQTSNEENEIHTDEEIERLQPNEEQSTKEKISTQRENSRQVDQSTFDFEGVSAFVFSSDTRALGIAWWRAQVESTIHWRDSHLLPMSISHLSEQIIPTSQHSTWCKIDHRKNGSAPRRILLSFSLKVMERTIAGIPVRFRWSCHFGIGEEFSNRIQRKTGKWDDLLLFERWKLLGSTGDSIRSDWK